MCKYFMIVVVAGVMLACVSSAWGVQIETEVVGDIGNAPDDTTYGAVGYLYYMGKKEVTAGQYCEFLNAVAGMDPYGLYNGNMWSLSTGCKILREGSSGNYTYSVADDWADRPVNFVSWGDAARFCNWLHNGQPMESLTGVVDHDRGVTEDGSYTLEGVTSEEDLMLIVRNTQATWVIPSENEWYKAAYYDKDIHGYWNYPTGTDTAPGYITGDGSGGLVYSPGSSPFTEGGTGGDSDPGNYATYDGSGSFDGIGSPYYRTKVGEHENSKSPYGTLDQGGNVLEWTEGKMPGFTSAHPERHATRGGMYDNGEVYLHASERVPGRAHEGVANVGFRVARIPAPCPPPITIETVPVGYPGNTGELSGPGVFGGVGPISDRICGSVPYFYWIGKYEITAGQYCVFLNAVAAHGDKHSLYNLNMWADPDGCKIKQEGNAVPYTYSVASGCENLPVNFVSWGDAARFCNWLHNGQICGEQDVSTTEEGAYSLSGKISASELLSVARNANWQWAIPSEDEWYKAAYHKGIGTGADYWEYPTESDVAPTAEAPPGGDLTNGSANYYDGFILRGPSERGAYKTKDISNDYVSDGAYGTFDQGGNVWEWNEAILLKCPSVMGRGMRGGSFSEPELALHASHRNGSDPTTENSDLGFRVSAPCLVSDLNGDGLVDMKDFAIFAKQWGAKKNP
ncbi:MAG: SUMF1/EgtB/PvdO family nonheme iron enzyme [Sedimentisphaerales bacterium]|nr:SUMF1/EgtB/PvdO family nonheme iron enzyme [Sedimentisphaerales bacterium]